MYAIKEQFINRNIHTAKFIEIHLDDEVYVKINTKDNSDMTFDTFNLLCRNGYSFLFDLTNKLN